MISQEFDPLVRRARTRPLWTPLSTTREVQYGRAEVERILPHRGRSLLVDAVTAVDLDQWGCRALRQVAADDPGFDGHFPGEPLYPGSLQLELVGQTGGCLLHFLDSNSCVIREDARARNGRVIKLHHALFLAEVRPGDVMTVLVKGLVNDEMTSIFAGQVLRGETICTVTIMEVYFVDS
ncbi:MAG: 3-hydroxyacyl-[acyl-carrier-protein] dehydratase [Chthoniobacter sp.]|jgi:3-hydroxymyristoyl/3-hydroxydecanoyl-(acyl carrier protein) dehydratase|nr:3-hydroxyacyl-[acyl-carrier-protein] dehydratase [Chthoniobacter sp.]